MKISFIQSIIGMVFCGITMAHDNYGQMLSEKITVNLSETTLHEALNTIREQTGIRFIYSNSQIDVSHRVSIAATDKQLKEILEQLLTPLHISYKVQDQERIITLRMDKEEQSLSNQIDLTRINKDLITGKVIDAVTKQPIAGVYVIIKNSSDGTSTDGEGEFAIETEKDDILVFSFIGYSTVEISVSNRSVIDIELVEDLKTFTEVIVNAGYWTVKEREATGNISKISSAEISSQPVSNPLQALQGRVPGLYIQQMNGVPGSSPTVRIRGQNSLNSGNEPLYIIDNVPFMTGNLSTNSTSANILGTSGISPLNSINPADIESIEVLKDADATAIYGSRGANGVILITTKKGKASKGGHLAVEINMYTGFSKVAHQVSLLSTPQYIAMRKEAFALDKATPTLANAPDLLAWDTTRYTNWQKELIGRTARTSNIQATVSGGDKNTRFSLNAGYEHLGTVFPGSQFADKWSSRLSVNHSSQNNRFRASFAALYSFNKSNLIMNDYTRRAVTLAPNAPELYKEDGTLNWQNATWTNPLNELEGKYKATTSSFVANANLLYEVIKGVEVSSSFGFNDMQNEDMATTPSTFYNPVFNLTPASARLALNNASSQSWIIEPKISWTYNISNGILSVFGGTTFQNKLDDKLYMSGTGFASDALINDIGSASRVVIGDWINTTYRYTAVYGRVNYNHDDKYIINATARRDGSSRFGPDNRFANFAAAGVAWVFSKEKFMEPLSFLSFGKLRMSYGVTGNDQIGDYKYLSTYQSSGMVYQGINGMAPSSLYNPNFAWELNRKWEAGVELGFLNDRLNVASSFYRNRSSNQLISYPLAMTTGFTGVQANLDATIQNQGWELALNSSNLMKRDFRWSSSFNFSLPSNKLIAFPMLASSSYASRYEIGKPITISKLYHFLGVNAQTGLYEFEDMNVDGRITTADQLAVKNIGVKYFGGLNNTFSWRGWQLDLFFQYVKQTGLSYMGIQGVLVGLQFNQPPNALANRWQAEGDTDKTKQRLSTGTYPNAFNSLSNYTSSDAMITDASFIRLKNASLSYTLPSKWTKQKLATRLYVQGQNLLTFTNYFGLDPENYSFSLPPLRTIAFGAQFTL